MKRKWTNIGLAAFGIMAGLYALTPAVSAVTYPGINGSIAVSHMRQGVPNVWLAGGVTGPMWQLTHDGATSPEWSPDGTRLVAADNRGRLNIVNEQGRVMNRLPSAPNARDMSPVWSPDGLRVAFIRQELLSGRSAVLSVSVGSPQVNNISGWTFNGHYRTPSWSPDGHNMAYELAMAGQKMLYIKNLSTGAAKLLVMLAGSNPSEVTWSPNGQKLLFQDSLDQVYTIWPDGSHKTVISDGDSRGAAWSPDGQRLAFIEDEGISLTDPDGTVRRSYPEVDGQRINAVTWSPDGSKIAFLITTKQKAGIKVLDISTQKVTSAAQGMNSPSGLSWQAKSVEGRR